MAYSTSVVLWALAAALTIYMILSRIALSVHVWRASRKNGCLPPPKYSHWDPILGLDMFFDQFKAMKDGNTTQKERERFRRYGKTFEANSWGTRCIHTMEVANIQAVLSILFDKFGVAPLRLSAGSPFVGKGVFTTDGAEWRHSRELIKPIFARAQIVDFSALDVHLDRMMSRIPRDKTTFDLQELLKLMFLDHSTEMIFGKSTEILLAASPDTHSNELLEAFNAALRGLGKRILLGRLRIFFVFDGSYNRLAHRVHAVLDKYIDQAKARQASKHNNETSLTNTRTRYVILDELVNTLKDRAEIRNEIINIFLPARDASGVGLSGACFLLARHPRVWHKLRAEVLSIQGELTYDILKSLKYMRYVLNESYRLIMPVNRNARLCLKDCVLPSGGGPGGTQSIFVPQGTQVSVNFGAMHRDKDIWGDDTDEFRPERWEGMKIGWHYIPFSGGPRICPGQQIGLAESAYVLARLMQKFKTIENRDPEMSFIEESRLTIESRNGVKIALIPA